MTEKIAISGIDGSGKSTVASLLKCYFNSKSIKVKILWFRWRALTLYGLYLYSRLRGLYLKVYIPRLGRKIGIHVFHIDPVAKVLYPYLLFLDLSIYYLLHIFLTVFLRVKVIIYDRFFIDALADVIYSCRYINTSILKLYLSAQKRASKAVILDINADLALRRKRDIISRKELEFKRRVFLILSKYLQIPIINASQDLATVVRDTHYILTSER